jgi:hypothetical protein
MNLMNQAAKLVVLPVESTHLWKSPICVDMLTAETAHPIPMYLLQQQQATHFLCVIVVL